MQDEMSAGVSAGAVSGGASRTHGARVANMGVPSTIISVEIGIADPHQALLFVFFAVRLQLFAEALHHAREVRSPVAVSANPMRALVGEPQLLRRVGQKSVNVRCHLEVGEGAANFQNLASLLLEWSIDRHPDRLDEEVLVQNDREKALALRDSTRRSAEMPILIRAARA